MDARGQEIFLDRKLICQVREESRIFKKSTIPPADSRNTCYCSGDGMVACTKLL